MADTSHKQEQRKWRRIRLEDLFKTFMLNRDSMLPIKGSISELIYINLCGLIVAP